jgi:hypothetical protein
LYSRLFIRDRLKAFSEMRFGDFLVSLRATSADQYSHAERVGYPTSVTPSLHRWSGLIYFIERLRRLTLRLSVTLCSLAKRRRANLVLQTIGQICRHVRRQARCRVGAIVCKEQNGITTLIRWGSELSR